MIKRARRRGVVAGLLAALATMLTYADAAPGSWPEYTAQSMLSGDEGAPTIITQKRYGAAGDDYPFDIWSADDGFILVGRTQDVNTDDTDAFIMKVDQSGEIKWSRRWGGDALEMAFAVRVRPDQSIVVAGWTLSYGAGEGDFFLLGLDCDGQTLFEKTFGGERDDRAVQMTLTSDGGIAIFGESYSYGAGDSRFYLVKTDGDGNLLWENTYDAGPLNERGLAIVESDHGFLLAGNSMDATSGSRAVISDGYVVMTDHDGNELWNRRLGGDAHDIIHHASPLSEDEFVLTGYSRSFDAGEYPDIWVSRINGAGDILESYVSGGDLPDHNVIARPLPDGGVVLGGYSQSFGAGEWDAQIIALNRDSSIDWRHVYGGPGSDGAVSIMPYGDGMLAIVGYTITAEQSDRDVLFMVIDAKTRSVN